MSKSLETANSVSVEPVIPPLHFKEHPDHPNFKNETLYIPEHVATSNKTKAVYVSTSAATRAAAIKRVHREEPSNNENDANDKNGGSANHDPVDDDEQNEDAMAAKRLKQEVQAEETTTGRPRRGTR